MSGDGSSSCSGNGEMVVINSHTLMSVNLLLFFVDNQNTCTYFSGMKVLHKVLLGDIKLFKFKLH